jgi:fructoselysine-6-P-deglycase FrlB-like protein
MEERRTGQHVDSNVAMQIGSLATKVDAEVVATVGAGVSLFLGTVIALVANSAPTVNAGDTVKIQTPAGEPNRTVTVQ